MQISWVVGVDVAKASVVAACAEFGVREVPNHAQALKAWLKTLPQGSRIAMEATGRYHGLLADLAHECGPRV